jgi:H/ACA ribonucleoprotein complex subunit 4
MRRIKTPWEVKRSLAVKAKEETNPRFGHRPEERPLQDYLKLGIINLDKPAGPSSHEVTAWVKRILSLKRAGHGGTLET